MEKMKITLDRLLYVGAACAAMFLAPIAQAGSLHSGAPLFGDPVVIDYLGVDNSTAAGAFEKATFNGGSIPNFWCIDLTHTVPYPPWTLQHYTEAPFQSAPLAFSGTQVSNLRTLFANNYSNALFSSPDNAAAFQLAIWDILFDTDGNLATSGGGVNSAFGVESVTSANASTVLATAQGWITTAETGPQHPYTLTQLTSSAGNQSFIYPGPLSVNVPEPSGLALLGAALVAMMFVTRRRRTGGYPA